MKNDKKETAHGGLRTFQASVRDYIRSLYLEAFEEMIELVTNDEGSDEKDRPPKTLDKKRGHSTF